MRENPLKKNSRFYLGMVLNVAEGMLSGFNFLLLYEAMKMLWNGTINSPSLLRLSLFLGGVFILRIVIYSIGYTQSQIGGAAVSNRTRLFLGDKIKRIPLSRFTQGQTGQYINIVTSDVNNYEKILTHTVGDILKHITFCTMMVIFVGCIWLPGGIILACVELVLIPFLWLSFRVVRKYGTEKNAVSAETVSSIVEYATGIQTFRAYGIGGTKNETVTSTLQHFSDVSYNYEKHGIPTNAIQCIFLWIGLPVMIWAASIPMLSGKLDPISYLLICMLPMLLAKLSDSISRGLMSYKNLKISKDKVVDIIEEPEETGSMEPLHDLADPKYSKWYPLMEWGWDREECIRQIEAAGLPQPGKSSCFFCPSMRAEEIIDLREHYPDLFRRALALEDNAKANLKTVRGLGRNYSWKERFGKEFI